MRSSGSNIDLAIALLLAFGINPLLEAIFNAIRVEKDEKKASFHSTILYGAAFSISSGAKAWSALLIAHAAQDILHWKLPIEADLIQVAPHVGIIVWFCTTLSVVKHRIFRRAISGTRLGRVGLYDRLIDFLLTVAALGNILKVLSIEVGVGLQSIFAASGFSALAFSLASKGLVEQIIGGFFIHAWDAIEEGEIVRLGDGTEGTIHKIGLTETIIVGYDNIATRIPNSQLTMQRVSNISRLTMSQIKQFIRLKYTDLDRIPKLLEDIKKEIIVACPKVISDGSKAFQAILTAYEPDHIQAVVNCHFPFRPMCAEYAETRQSLLLAIAKAMKNNNVEFAIPSINYETKRPPEGL